MPWQSGEFSEGKRKTMNGAGDGIRTRDIDLGKVALYQLSYSRSTKTSFSPETILMSNVSAK
jgi:hypothetical protein